MKRRVLLILIVFCLGLQTGNFCIVKKSIAERDIRLDAKLIIITKQNLLPVIEDFVSFKRQQGFNVKIETIEDLKEKEEKKDLLEEKIRIFLKEEYEENQSLFTLLIGDDIPLKKISPPSYFNPASMDYFFYTDFYYCDLFSDWDQDKNGKFGESIADINFSIVNRVGRIPFSDPHIVKKILDNIIQQSKKENSYKALMAIMQFADPKYLEKWDLAQWAELGKQILEKEGYKTITLYEKEGKSQSKYTPTDSLNQQNFNKYLLSNPDLLVTVAHGDLKREIWEDSNKNNVFETSEIIKKEFFSLKDLENTTAFTKIWFDYGCSNSFRSWEIKYPSRPLWFASADEILKYNVASTLIGSTEEPPWYIYVEELTNFLHTLVVEKKPIGEWLRVRFNNKPIDIYDLMLNIVGDPTFTLFPEEYFRYYDNTAPCMLIETPSIINSKKIKLKGTVIDNSEKILLTIKVNGVTLLEKQKNLDNSVFEEEVELKEGDNLINCIAKDQAGNEVNREFHIICDTTPPIIELEDLPQWTKNATFLLKGNIKDRDSGIKRVIINNKEEIALIQNQFEITINLLLGNNEIVIEAEDLMGNKSKISKVIKRKIEIRLEIGKPIIYINDLVRKIDVSPVIIEGRTFLPIRYIAEPLGAQVQWDPKEKQVIILLQDKQINLWVGKNKAQVNGKDILIDPNNPKVVPLIIKGRTMLPVRFVAENMGCRVDWYPPQVIITYPAD